jgi:hypothetical protein
MKINEVKEMVCEKCGTLMIIPKTLLMLNVRYYCPNSTCNNIVYSDSAVRKLGDKGT